MTAKDRRRSPLPTISCGHSRSFKDAPCILEVFVDFAFEASVVGARGADGSFAAYDPPENAHEQPYPQRSTVPSRLSAAQSDEAKAIAKKIADALDYVGVLAVELFVVQRRIAAGERDRAARAQFRALDDRCLPRQPVRAPYPRGRRLAARSMDAAFSDAVMENLIGEEAADWRALAARGGACISTENPKPARAARWAISPGLSREGRRVEAFQDLCERRHIFAVPSFISALNFSNCITFSMRGRGTRASRFALAGIVEPAHQRRGIDACQDCALGVEIEIGGGVAAAAPHRIDRPHRQVSRPAARWAATCRNGGGAARGFLVRRSISSRVSTAAVMRSRIFISARFSFGERASISASAVFGEYFD